MLCPVCTRMGLVYVSSKYVRDHHSSTIRTISRLSQFPNRLFQGLQQLFEPFPFPKVSVGLWEPPPPFSGAMSRAGRPGPRDFKNWKMESSAEIEDETQRTVDNLEKNMTSRVFDAVFLPTNPFIIVSIPAVSVMLCQTAWIGGTYIPLPPPGEGLYYLEDFIFPLMSFNF